MVTPAANTTPTPTTAFDMIHLLAEVFLISCILWWVFEDSTHPTGQRSCSFCRVGRVFETHRSADGCTIHGGSSKTRPTLRLEEEHHFFVEVLPDAVEEGITHRPIAAVDFHFGFVVGYE